MAHLHFDCWRCGEENLLYGDPCDCCDLIDVDSEWDCWSCGALNTTPDEHEDGGGIRGFLGRFF